MNQWRFLNISCLLLLLSICLFFSCKEPEQIIEIDLEEFKVEHHIVIGQTMAKQIGEMPETFNVLDSATYHVLKKEVKKLPEVVKTFPYLEFSEDKVFDADKYAISLICPFQYDISGLQQLLSRANNNVEWLHSKNGEDLNDRLARIEEYASECGEGGVTNYQQYQRKIKNFLP